MAEGENKDKKGEAPGKKVELDLDDAPFLQEEPEPSPAPKKEESPATSESSSLEAPATEPRVSLKDRLKAQKKRLILAGASALVLILAAVGVNMFLGGAEKTPPPTAPTEITMSSEPAPEPPAPLPKHLVDWEPFWVEIKDQEGEVRFLQCKFSLSIESEPVFIEVINKRMALRDAVYYYLKNRPYTFLMDQNKIDLMKRELINIIGEYINSGKIDDLLIENFLIK